MENSGTFIYMIRSNITSHRHMLSIIDIRYDYAEISSQTFLSAVVYQVTCVKYNLCNSSII